MFCLSLQPRCLQSFFNIVSLLSLTTLIFIAPSSCAQDITVHSTGEPRGQSGSRVTHTSIKAQSVYVPTRIETQAKSKASNMLPSRMYGRVRLTEAATHRLPVISSDAMKGGGGKGQPLQIGVARSLSVNPTTQGGWFDLGNAGSALVFGVVSKGAAQVRVHFSDADLPPGAKLFVRSMSHPDDTYGPFEGRGALGDGTFWSPPVRGDGVVIEYLDPHPRKDKSHQKRVAPFRINQISHIFRD